MMRTKIFALSFFLFASVLSHIFFAFAQENENVLLNIKTVEREIENIKVQKQKTTAKKVQKQKNLQNLEKQKTIIENQTFSAQKTLQTGKQEIGKVSQELQLLDADVVSSREKSRLLLTSLQENDKLPPLLALFSGMTLSQIANVSDQSGKLSKEFSKQTYNLRFQRALSAEKKQTITSEQQEAEELLLRATQQKQILADARSKNLIDLKTLKEKEKEVDILLAEKEALKKAFEEELRQYEASLSATIDNTKLPARGSGVLSWPLANDILVTQMFGVKTGPHRIYANGHGGTDFRAKYEPAYAMADGVVDFVGDTDKACRGASFGKFVFLRFDNNLAATYGHFSIISVSKGQRVKRGQLVGYTGNSGRSTGPHLHISVYAGIDSNGKSPVNIVSRPSKSCKNAMLVMPVGPHEAYLDPIDFLPPLNSGMKK